jgi:hypothetical protein
MSYFSGTAFDYQSRLHSLPTSSGDYQSFLIEGNGYYSQMTGLGLQYLVNYWNVEFIKKGFSGNQITGV